tara:strand:+ start:622 stop:2304 length:1683 start_codon:yes stop_codon:yes gene_type:complete
MNISKEGDINYKELGGSIENNNVLELDRVIFFLKKYYKIFIITTLVFTGFGYFRAKGLKKLWQGEFQIVLSTKSIKSGSADLISNLGLGNFGIKAQNDLKTELEILKSQSVLYPAFQDFKKIRVEKGIQSENWDFNSFKSNVNIKLIDGTSVLVVQYKSPYKDLIPLALEKISEIYQKYSYLDKEKDLENISRYLDEQISIYKIDSDKSLIKLNNFSQEYGLSYKFTEDKNVVVDVELKRIESANKIREIDQKINFLNKVYDDDEKFIYNGRNFFDSDILSRITEIDNQLNTNNAIFKENDISFEALKSLKSSLVQSLKDETFGLLNSRKLALEAEVKALERPPGVINKFKQLVRELKVKETTLVNLERERNAVLLEKAIEKGKWEIITDISVLPNYVSPNTKKITAIFFFLGFFLSLITLLIYENRKDLVFDSKEIERILDVPILLDLSNTRDNELKPILKIASKGNLKFSLDKTISINVIGDLPKEIIEKISKIFKNNFPNKFKIKNDFNEFEQGEISLLVICLGFLKNNELRSIKKILNLNAINFSGIVIFDKQSIN